MSTKMASNAKPAILIRLSIIRIAFETVIISIKKSECKSNYLIVCDDRNFDFR